MTSQLSSGRSRCQNGQKDEESSAYYTGTATAASLGSHEYLDNRWLGLMCTPISDSYLTPLEELTTGPCQAAPGVPALLPVSHCSPLLKSCPLHRAARALHRLRCALFSSLPGIGWKLVGGRQWKYFWWHRYDTEPGRSEWRDDLSTETGVPSVGAWDWNSRWKGKIDRLCSVNINMVRMLIWA